MIVTTEHGRYEVEELPSRRFRVRRIESWNPPGETPCRSGRYRSHGRRSIELATGVVVENITLRIGGELQFFVNDEGAYQASTEQTCCETNRITAIEP